MPCTSLLLCIEEWCQNHPLILSDFLLLYLYNLLLAFLKLKFRLRRLHQQKVNFFGRFVRRHRRLIRQFHYRLVHYLFQHLRHRVQMMGLRCVFLD
jgi:hypothetical protein